ncbi:AzlC family ABC transporter permease [Metallumcola ferriviriculae]|uniref:AzlC family ABC transporter permease n=1 Tax=Metallumcola ferriviriculae TaxID=3039180 RepID=A0AAU0UPL0_9FIRM|nr:AzlC family ABC transporter permease [Desulfitibacteraceae bacterium MK1]
MARNRFLAGVKAALPIVMGYMPLGFAYGVLAREAGLSLFQTTMMSVLVYAGSGQFIAVGLMGAAVSAAAVIFTVFLVNLRHLLMSASLIPHLKHYPVPLLGFVSYQITDETYAVAISHFQEEKATESFHMGLNLTAHSAWVLASFLGGAFGNLIRNPAQYGLNFALPAMFIALLIMQVKDKAAILVGLAAAIISIAIKYYSAGSWNIILATIAAATLGVIFEWITSGQ